MRGAGVVLPVLLLWGTGLLVIGALEHNWWAVGTGIVGLTVSAALMLTGVTRKPSGGSDG